MKKIKKSEKIKKKEFSVLYWASSFHWANSPAKLNVYLNNDVIQKEAIVIVKKLEKLKLVSITYKNGEIYSFKETKTGHNLLKDKKYKKWLGDLTESVKKEGLNSSENLVGKLYSEAGNAFAKDDFVKAIELYTKVIAINPLHPSAYFNRALAYALTKRYFEAEKDAQMAIELEPNKADAPYIMGQIQEYKNDFVAAKQWYIRALSKDPYFAAADKRLRSLKEKVPSNTAKTPNTEKSKITENEQKVRDLMDSLAVSINLSFHIGAYQKTKELNEFIETFRGLLDTGIDINVIYEDGETLLDLAARALIPDVVELLLEKGADANLKGDNGNTQLHLMFSILRKINENAISIIKLLISKGAFVNSKNLDGDTPLILCARRWEPERYDIIKLLLQNGADVNAKSNNYMTALHWASSSKNVMGLECINLLISKGALIDAKTTNGLTPLLWAVQMGNETTVELLISKGANIKAKEDGRTALHLAMMRGFSNLPEEDEKMIRFVISKGIDVNSRDSVGSTPLMIAALFGRIERVRLIVSSGADINLVDNLGKNALDYAKQTTNKSMIVIDFLESLGLTSTR